jgi:hypothetical protein
VCGVPRGLPIAGAHGFTISTCRFSSLVGIDGVVSYSQPDFVTEQSVEVLELVSGFLCGFLTKFLLHFIAIHRDDSPANEIDDLCIRSFRKLRAFALGYSLTPLTHRVDGFPVLRLLRPFRHSPFICVTD